MQDLARSAGALAEAEAPQPGRVAQEGGLGNDAAAGHVDAAAAERLGTLDARLRQLRQEVPACTPECPGSLGFGTCRSL